MALASSVAVVQYRRNLVKSSSLQIGLDELMVFFSLKFRESKDSN